MKKQIIPILVLALVFGSCASQRITGTYINHEALPKEPFKSVFILTLAHNLSNKVYIENRLAEYISARGQKAVKSSDVIPAGYSKDNDLSKEQLTKIIMESGCDAVLTLAVLDVTTEERYEPGSVYYPMNRGFYGSYYGYYGYYSPRIYQPGYYVTDQTYYLETNFYDVKAEKLLWSIQSDAYNPSSLERWYKEYAHMITYKLKKEGLISK